MLPTSTQRLVHHAALFLSMSIFSAAIALHSFNGPLLPADFFGGGSLAVTLVPFSFGIICAGLSLYALRFLSLVSKRACAWGFAFLYILNGSFAVASGFLTLGFLDVVGKMATNQGGTPALFEADEGETTHDESLLFFSDTLLGVYSGCCGSDFLKPCMQVVYSAGVPFCYDSATTYNNAIAMVNNGYNYTICVGLAAPPESYCPESGDVGHDIPLFLKSVHEKLAGFWMPTGAVLTISGFAMTFVAVVFMCYLCRYARSPAVSYAATDIDYGTPIKETHADLVVV